jgi:hypothetical protein
MVVPAPDATPLRLVTAVDAALKERETPLAPVSMNGLDTAIDVFDATIATSHAVPR